MVELNTGRTERLLALPHPNPDLLIDDATAQLFQASGRRITALRLRRGNSPVKTPQKTVDL